MASENETVEDIVKELLGIKGGQHTNGGLSFERWRARCQFADDYAERFKAAHQREREATREKQSQVGNAAKIREALSDACSAMFSFLKTQNGGYEEMAKALDKAKAALAEPPRNCDRPECATTKSAQNVWRKEDGGKTAYYEWILATSM